MAIKMTALAAYLGGKLPLPPGYRIDHSADAMVLRRGDGSVVAAFVAAGTPPGKVARLAERDFRARQGTR